MKNILYIIILLCFVSCKKNYNQEVEIIEPSEIISKDKINQLLQNAINLGDTLAYDSISSYSVMQHTNIDFYYYSQLMANKYSYSKAYYDLYKTLSEQGTKINNIDIYSSDKHTKQLANYYLLKSWELGFKRASVDIKQIFGDSIPHSKTYFCND